MCLMPCLMLLMMHQTDLHQPGRLDRCSPLLHIFLSLLIMWDQCPSLGRLLQDTVPIHSAIISQRVALGALAEGRPWLDAQMAALRQNRHAVLPLRWFTDVRVTLPAIL